jgi:uncharacterized membrane protein
MNTPRLALSPAVKLVLATMLALAAWATWRLPPATPIAIHFDITGRPDAWTAHTGPGLLLYPALALLIALLLAGLLRVLPTESPAEQAVRSIRPALTLTLALLLVVLQWAALRAAFDLTVPIALPAFLLGGLLVGTGNGMAKLRPNRWVGIRTPWTLANPHIWDQTHRFGGWVFVLSGLALLVVSVAPLSKGQQQGLLMALLCFAVLAPVLRSYQLSRRLPCA